MKGNDSTLHNTQAGYYAQRIRDAKTIEEATEIARVLINKFLSQGYNDGAAIGYDIGFDDGYKMCEWDFEY